MSQRRKKLLWVIFALAAVFAAWYFFAKGKADKTPAPQVVIISEVAAERKDVPLTIQNVATVKAYQTVGVRSRLDSQIMEVKFKDGDMVKQGDTLFILDDRTLKAQVAELE